MTDENTIVETTPIESAQNEVALNEAPSKPKTFKKKRDIFRFNGSEEMSIDLGHVYKMVRKEKRITFYTPFASPSNDDGGG